MGEAAEAALHVTEGPLTQASVEAQEALSPADLLAVARLNAPANIAIGAVNAMLYALVPLMETLDAGEDALVEFMGIFDGTLQWAPVAHDLIVDHPGLPADALWLHLTARGLLPKTAECFADLPDWQRHGFGLLLAAYAALWPGVKAALDRRGEELRFSAELAAPARSVKLSETIFERHGRISDLVDGLRVTPKR